jgi:hypothetical protein
MGPVLRPKRHRTRKILTAVVLDIVLLPLAIVVVLFEDVLWRAAQALLQGLGSSPPMRAAHAWVAGLPALAVLPLFLLPEGISHIAGFLSAYLFAQRKVAAAIALLVLVKGTATLAVVWIYQAASPTLLGVRWFARMHDAVHFIRLWSQAKVAPLRQALRARLGGSAKFGARVSRRFRALRFRLVAWWKNRRTMF